MRRILLSLLFVFVMPLSSAESNCDGRISMTFFVEDAWKVSASGEDIQRFEIVSDNVGDLATLKVVLSERVTEELRERTSESIG